MVVAMVLVVSEPSPKSQLRFVIVPVEVSVKFTVKGTEPLVWPALNSAWGKVAPAPRTGLVTLPPLLVLNTRLLLEATSLIGANRTTTLVVPNPATVKLLPDTTLKGGLTLTVPPVTCAPPRFVTTNVCCAFEPTATHP